MRFRINYQAMRADSQCTLPCRRKIGIASNAGVSLGISKYQPAAGFRHIYDKGALRTLPYGKSRECQLTRWAYHFNPVASVAFAWAVSDFFRPIHDVSVALLSRHENSISGVDGERFPGAGRRWASRCRSRRSKLVAARCALSTRCKSHRNRAAISTAPRRKRNYFSVVSCEHPC
jgi:hypothetical protein